MLWHVGHIAHRERLHIGRFLQGASGGLIPPQYEVFGAEWCPVENVRAPVVTVCATGCPPGDNPLSRDSRDAGALLSVICLYTYSCRRGTSDPLPLRGRLSAPLRRAGGFRTRSARKPCSRHRQVNSAPFVNFVPQWGGQSFSRLKALAFSCNVVLVAP